MTRVHSRASLNITAAFDYFTRLRIITQARGRARDALITRGDTGLT